MTRDEAIAEIAAAKAKGRRVNLYEVNLSGADLRGADLSGADLRGADLRGANLYEVNLRGAYLRGADLRGAELSGADLSGADLSGAELSGADLSGADLRGANLYEVNLRGADLAWAIGNEREVKSLLCFERVITYTATHIFVGCQTRSIDEWFNITDDELQKMSPNTQERWRKWEPIIKQIIDAYPATKQGETCKI